MEYQFTTYKFQGPLDLLLHLIKVADIDIFDIDVAKITEQYLDYIESMECLNLNVDSEYLVMAAELIEMKSRYLLPNDENSDEEDEEDPRENLINRLLEYQKYKELSLKLRDMESERKYLYSKSSSELTDFKGEDVVLDEDVSLDDLLKAFMEFRKRKILEEPLDTVITRKEYSVSKRCNDIMKKLRQNKKVNFEELFDIRNKSYVVVTFLAILDLAKKGQLKIKQDKTLDKIVLEEVGV